MPKILVTGGSGYLGQHLSRLAEKCGTLHTTYRTHPKNIIAGEAHPLDITDASAVFALIESLAPDAIIHTAASNPGRQNPSQMMTINRDGSKYIAEAARAIGARLVHVSTDTVHAGTHAPYPADAPPSPINPYGKSKAAAESAVRTACPTAAIVRTSLIYGLKNMDRGTAGFLKRLNAGETLTLFQDQIRQPVWIETLSEVLLALALEKTNIHGTLNVVGRQVLSREAFGKRMLKWWGIDAQDRIKAGFAANLVQPSPLDLRLEIAQTERLLGMTFYGVDEVMQICQSQQS